MSSHDIIFNSSIFDRKKNTLAYDCMYVSRTFTGEPQNYKHEVYMAHGPTRDTEIQDILEGSRSL